MDYKFNLEEAVKEFVEDKVKDLKIFTDKFKLYYIFLALIWLFYIKYKEE